MVKQDVAPTVLMAQLGTIGRYQMMVLGYIFVIFAVFGELFIHLFVGAEFSEAFLVALIPMVPFIFVLAQSSTNAVLQALNKHKVRSLLLLATALANVVISIILVKKLGMIGAVWGTAIALVVGELLLVNIYLYRVVGLNMLNFYQQLLRYSMPVILISMPLAFALANYLSATWLGLILGCFFTGLIYLVLSYFLSLMVPERKAIKRLIFSW